jgi:hypothetical protein
MTESLFFGVSSWAPLFSSEIKATLSVYGALIRVRKTARAEVLEHQVNVAPDDVRDDRRRSHFPWVSQPDPLAAAAPARLGSSNRSDAAEPFGVVRGSLSACTNDSFGRPWGRQGDRGSRKHAALKLWTHHPIRVFRTKNMMMKIRDPLPT